MGNITLEPPESAPAPRPDTNEPHATAAVSISSPTGTSAIAASHAAKQPVQPKPRSLYWRPKPSDVPALSVLLGLVIVALVVLSLVIALIGGGSTTTVYQGGGMTMGSSASSAATYPVHAVPAHPMYDARPTAAPTGDVVNVKLVTSQALISIAPNVAYHAWTFNGTVPGPIIRVRHGQTINFTLDNQDGMPHSIDFHAAQTPWNTNYKPVEPGKSFSFSWKANYPGVFMYHCGTPPAMYHMANGMYGAIIVDPANGWSPAQEYALVQSEFYTRQSPDGTYSLDGQEMMAVQPDFVTFNGYADQYKSAPLMAKPGQKSRLFIVNAGPSQFSAFHVIGAIFSDVYVDGNPANHSVGDQTITIPPGGGLVVELTIPDVGKYPFVSHSFSAASTGATGVLSIQP